jgi:hypothetical protein
MFWQNVSFFTVKSGGTNVYTNPLALKWLFRSEIINYRAPCSQHEQLHLTWESITNCNIKHINVKQAMISQPVAILSTSLQSTCLARVFYSLFFEGMTCG